MRDLTKALLELCPGSAWSLVGNEYGSLVWLDKYVAKPTKEEINQKLDEIDQRTKDAAYIAHRAAEYPPITDYLDAVVKNDTEQMQAYIDACLAVKVKYPKPE